VKLRAAHLLLLSGLLYSASLPAQISPALNQIHAHLQDWRWMAQRNAFVFAGEIETMRPVRTHRCRSGSQEKLEYIVRDLLRSNPDSYVHNGYVVGESFVDCAQKSLPAPFEEGSKVILLCSLRPAMGYTCLPPAEATETNLNPVRQWVAELRSRQIDPVLLQLHEHLLEDAELIQKSHVPGTFTVNGETVRPLVFSVEVTWIAPVPMIHTVTVPRLMDVAVSRVLFGDEIQRQIRVACRSNRCGGATVGSKVVGYCRVGRMGAQDCLLSVTSPRMSVPVVKQWLVEAGLESQADSDFEHIHAEVTGTGGHQYYE
jgi:hypothetical protein